METGLLEGRTDRHDETNSRFSQFWESTQKWIKKNIFRKTDYVNYTIITIITQAPSVSRYSFRSLFVLPLRS
jgi:hypothetical protein